MELQRRLRPGAYHVLPVIGYCGFDDASGESTLLLEGGSGRGRPASGTSLRRVARDKVNLRLVMLNACEGARIRSRIRSPSVA